MPVMVDFADPEQFASVRRVTGLVASQDGERLVVTCQEPDRDGARYASSLWDVDPNGDRAPQRLTWSEKGESTPAFMPDGSLLFVSARPHPEQVEDETALWLLPVLGEPAVYAMSPGGVADPVVARAKGIVVACGSRLPESADVADDKARREVRGKRKITGIVHDGFPIRYWDHELDDTLPRLFSFADSEGDVREPVDLIPDAREHLTNAAYSLSSDGSLLATTWRVHRRGGQMPCGLATLDMTSGEVRIRAQDDQADYDAPCLSPDGRWLAAIYATHGEFEQAFTYRVRVFDIARDDIVHDVDTGDLYPTELAWSCDAATLFISGDLHGRGGVASWRPGDARPMILLDDAFYSAMSPATDNSLFALRTTVDTPAQPVRISFATGDPTVTTLRSPAPPPQLPGRLERITAQAPDGATVGGWLCLPESASTDQPAPVQVWIHGGLSLRTTRGVGAGAHGLPLHADMQWCCLTPRCRRDTAVTGSRGRGRIAPRRYGRTSRQCWTPSSNVMTSTNAGQLAWAGLSAAT
jgi:dipeptidyl aminopeptidase/acylaminoacyl peptidase